ncbi:probable cytochrome P450 6a14 [Leptopilina heterotoma]|uniref:probable cytochrome P450 6a14 n=1 Tax=Leptopilina heterotoma TaxID=63436 RepID=UPI001CA800B6|nr:probable cytochrome P450 6a14 [Leptopilina heterotoma]
MAISLSNFVLEFFGVVTVVLLGVYLYFKLFIYNYWEKNGVQYIKPIVPVGNILNAVIGKQHIGVFFENAYEKMKKYRYGGLYTFHKPCLMIADLDLVKMVLTEKFQHFHDRGLYCNETVDPLSGHIFFLSGQKWENLRAKLTPIFTSEKLEGMFGIFKEKSDHLCFTLESHKQKIIEVKDIMARYTTDVIFTTAFGANPNSLDNPKSKFRYYGKKLFELSSTKTALAFYAPSIMDFLKIPLNDRSCSEFFMRIFTETFEHRVKNNIRRKDFLGYLIQLVNYGHLEEVDAETSKIADSLDGKITFMEAAAQAFLYFVGGFETSSATISHCLYELSVHQEIQEKVREEIKFALEKHGELSYDSLNSMPYLHQCVSETMRLYPGLTFFNRKCTKDIDLPTTNLHVKKGVDVVIPVLGIHLDPEIYPDPLKFDPERFTPENIAARHSYAYLPFGEGPRICIGMKFGYTQTKVALVNVLNKFQVTLGPNTPVPLVINPKSIVTYSSKEINLRFERL